MACAGTYAASQSCESHLYLSFRACPEGGGACAGGVLEVQVDANPPTRWWIRSNQEGFQLTIRKPDGARFSDECMPISVTSYGEQYVEGRGDGSTDYAFVALLWRGSSSATLEHTVAANGDLASSPHLVETLPSNVVFIDGRGVGAEGTSTDLYTYGSQVVRRTYTQE